MTLLNYTPHPVVIVTDNGSVTIPSECGNDAPRVLETARYPGDDIDQGPYQVPTFRVDYGSIGGLPEEVPGTLLIVPSMILDHPSARGRRDLVAPLDMVRDAAGRITGCRTFRRSGPNMR